VAIAEKTITIRQSYRERVGVELEMTDLAGIRPERAKPLAALPDTCPHCGSIIAYAAARDDARGEPFGA
jgi:hypothetical protein